MKSRFFVVAAPCAVSALAVAVASGTNMVQNGNFEDNTAGVTQFNLSHAAFDGFMANAASFGTTPELDIVTGLDFGVAPQSGDWKVGMHQLNDTSYDAFSLSLSTPVVAGQQYTVTFWGVGYSTFVPATLLIGLSSSATVFGTEIASGTSTQSSTWTEFSETFIAPANASFLTVRIAAPGNGYSFIDNISLTPAPGALGMLGLAGLAAVRRRR